VEEIFIDGMCGVYQAMSATRALDLDAAWRLHPQVALRPEPFGALLYHFGTRRLSFLQRPHRRQRDHITIGPPDRPLGIAGPRR